MDTSRFSKPEDEFSLLGLTARFAFKTDSSISFEVGKVADNSPEDDPTFVISAFTVIGWIDIHHPCDSRIKTQIRICMPAEYHTFERMSAMVKATCEALFIPADEHCISTVFSSDHGTIILPKVYFGMN